MTKTLSSPPPVLSSPSRPAHLKQMNTRGILQLMRENSPCSKADLVRLSGLSAPTVSSGVAELEGLGLIESLGDGASSGGRPPGVLRFNAERGYVAAADIGGTRLRMIIADLDGTSVGHWSTVFADDEKTPKAVCRVVREGLKTMCRENRIPLRKVLHVTAGAPGITNASTGVVLAAPNLAEWKDVPLRELLEDELGMPCLAENDTNLAAVGEHWRGVARDVDTFVFIAMGTGVGAGLFVGGRLHRGWQWAAGEIGYLGVAGKPRETMRVEKTGQLERAIGGAGIEAEWKRLAGRTQAAKGEPLRASHIFDLARDGDPVAAQVLGYTAAMLADAIADISLLLNPEMVVLGGGVGAHAELCRVTGKLLGRHELAQPLLRSSALGTQAQMFGAISLSLSAVVEQLIA